MQRLESIEQGSTLAEIARFGADLDGIDRVHVSSNEEWMLLLLGISELGLSGLALAGWEAGLLDITREQHLDLVELHLQAMLGSLAIERKLLELRDVFEAAEVDFVVLKGPALAHCVYPDPSWRPFGDLDLLVRSRDWAKACEALRAADHVRRMPEPRRGFDTRFGRAAVFTDEDGIQVDLHRAIAPGPFGMWIDHELLFDQVAWFRVGGLFFRRLNDSMLFLHQCIHATLGGWPPRLLSLRDVIEVFNDAWDQDEVVAWARRWRLAGVVRLACGTTASTLGVEALGNAGNSFPMAGADEDRALRACTVGRWNGGPALSTMRAIPGFGSKASYGMALLFPDRDFLRFRADSGNGSLLKRWMVPVTWILNGARGGSDRSKDLNR